MLAGSLRRVRLTAVAPGVARPAWTRAPSARSCCRSPTPVRARTATLEISEPPDGRPDRRGAVPGAATASRPSRADRLPAARGPARPVPARPAVGPGRRSVRAVGGHTARCRCAARCWWCRPWSTWPGCRSAPGPGRPRRTGRCPGASGGDPDVGIRQLPQRRRHPHHPLARVRPARRTDGAAGGTRLARRRRGHARPPGHRARRRGRRRPAWKPRSRWPRRSACICWPPTTRCG